MFCRLFLLGLFALLLWLHLTFCDCRSVSICLWLSVCVCLAVVVCLYLSASVHL